ncbi:hypothetical protein ACP4OV_007830 [Aristida adscensionis]
MAPDESFKRPGSIPFKWEVQPGIPKQQPVVAGDLPPTPRLAPPPAAAARASKLASASCRRSTSAAASSSALSPPRTPSQHRRSMSARFATSLVLPFTRRPRRGRSGSRDDVDVDFCVLYGEKAIM